MKLLLLAAIAAMTCSAAQGQALVACPTVYAPAATSPYLGRDQAQNAYDAAVNTAATVRTEYDMSAGEAYWQKVKASGPVAAYDVMYGPGAYVQAFELPKHPIY
jgi:hypothetical protein